MVCVSGMVVCVVCDGVWCGRVACDGGMCVVWWCVCVVHGGVCVCSAWWCVCSV